MASLAILLLLVRISGSIAVPSSNYISRRSQQLIVASVPPLMIPDADGQIAKPFLTSPSGSYAAYLRRATGSTGSLGGDACYVQIQQAGGGSSVWESDCTPVGGADACDLAFSPVGLELFDGGHSLWDTGVDDDAATLSLDDSGDMCILSKEGVTVWKASGEPWTTEQQCGGATLPASTSPSTDALPPPSTTTAKLVTPPAATLAGTWSADFSFGDQLAPPPPVDTVPAPDLPAQPPVDTAPEQPLAPPPADVSPDLPNPSLPPPAYTSPESPDLPMAPPPAEYLSPDQPLYSSLPPASGASGPRAALPPFGIPFPPPSGTGETSPDTPLPGVTAPPQSSPGGVPFSPFGPPHKQGSPHHDLPVGASPPPLQDTLAPNAHGQGAGAPLGHGQPQTGQGVFGQQAQLLDGEGHPLPLSEDSSGGWSRSSEHGRVAMCVVLAALIAPGIGF